MDPRDKANRANLLMQAFAGLTEDEPAEVAEAVFGIYATRPAKIRVIWDTETPRVAKEAPTIELGK